MNNSNNSILKSLVIVLLISNIIFAWLYFSKKTEQSETKDQLVSTEATRKKLDEVLQSTKIDLGNYKGRNKSLDSLVDVRNEEIREKAARIDELIRSDRISKAQLAKAQDELDILRWYVRKYAAQMDSFATANHILTVANDSLKHDLNSTIRKYDDVSKKNAVLQVKVDAAAKLKADGMTVTGLQKKNSGGYRETSRAKRTDAVKVQLSLADNIVTEKNVKDFYLRIIAPDGQTISDKSTGGVFTYQGEEYKYTQRLPLAFDNTGQKLIFTAIQDLAWVQGNYKVEVYCEGFMIGNADFKLD